LGDFGVFNVGAMAWREGPTGSCVGAAAASSPGISFTLVRSAPRTQMLQLVRSGATVVLDLHLPTDRPDIFLSCRIDLGSQDLSLLRRSFHQTANHRSSALVIAGMTLLLAICGWIVGGTEGVHRALTGGAPRQDGSAIPQETIFRWFGARLLRPAELPELFNMLAEVCHRARLSRLPDLYCLPAPHDMNAYALGGPDGAAIILTEGLLRGMTREEIAGILAHEVAHIRNNDVWTMSWAAALHRSIEWTSLAGLALLRAQHGGLAVSRPLAALLRAAPSALVLPVAVLVTDMKFPSERIVPLAFRLRFETLALGLVKCGVFVRLNDSARTCESERLNVPLRVIDVVVGVDFLELFLTAIEHQGLRCVRVRRERRLSIDDLHIRTGEHS